MEIELPPGAYELVVIDKTIKQLLSIQDFKLNIEADTLSVKSVLTTSNPIRFNSQLTKLLGLRRNS